LLFLLEYDDLLIIYADDYDHLPITNSISSNVTKMKYLPYHTQIDIIGGVFFDL